jgi:hypothetical protein
MKPKKHVFSGKVIQSGMISNLVDPTTSKNTEIKQDASKRPASKIKHDNSSKLKKKRSVSAAPRTIVKQPTKTATTEKGKELKNENKLAYALLEKKRTLTRRFVRMSHKRWMKKVKPSRPQSLFLIDEINKNLKRSLNRQISQLKKTQLKAKVQTQPNQKMKVNRRAKSQTDSEDEEKMNSRKLYKLIKNDCLGFNLMAQGTPNKTSPWNCLPEANNHPKPVAKVQKKESGGNRWVNAVNLSNLNRESSSEPEELKGVPSRLPKKWQSKEERQKFDSEFDRYLKQVKGNDPYSLNNLGFVEVNFREDQNWREQQRRSYLTPLEAYKIEKAEKEELQKEKEQAKREKEELKRIASIKTSQKNLKSQKPVKRASSNPADSKALNKKKATIKVADKKKEAVNKIAKKKVGAVKPAPELRITRKLAKTNTESGRSVSARETSTKSFAIQKPQKNPVQISKAIIKDKGTKGTKVMAKGLKRKVETFKASNCVQDKKSLQKEKNEELNRIIKGSIGKKVYEEDLEANKLLTEGKLLNKRSVQQKEDEDEISGSPKKFLVGKDRQIGLSKSKSKMNEEKLVNLRTTEKKASLLGIKEMMESTSKKQFSNRKLVSEKKFFEDEASGSNQSYRINESEDEKEKQPRMQDKENLINRGPSRLATGKESNHKASIEKSEDRARGVFRDKNMDNIPRKNSEVMRPGSTKKSTEKEGVMYYVRSPIKTESRNALGLPSGYFALLNKFQKLDDMVNFMISKHKPTYFLNLKSNFDSKFKE